MSTVPHGGGALARALTAVIFALVVLVGQPFAGGSAYADGQADEAELHFQIGAEAYGRGDFRTALEHFLASNRLVPNKNVVFNIARTFERLGRFADAHRYYVDAREGETDQKTITELEQALERIGPQVAVLNVVTDPPGATIYIDRKDLGSRGRTPRPLAVAPGKYTVIVELDGWEPAVREAVEAPLGSSVKIEMKLTRVVGTVHVDVKGAPHAAVHLDDESAPAICVAPCDLEAPPGTHILYFAQEGYQAQPRQVVIVAGKTVRVTALLGTLSGSILVETDESGAVVEVDGVKKGFTPVVIQNVPVGRRTVRVTARGFRPLEQVVEVTPGQQSELIGLRLIPIREVTAVSRLPEDIDLAPSSLSIIDDQELRAFGYPSIASALRGVRGVYISNDHTYESPGIRGIGEPNDYGNRVLVLQDGLNLNDNLLNSSYIGADGRVDLWDVERIEVVRGPGSLLYGTGAMSGVINLVPRGRDNTSQINAGVGTYDHAVARGRAGFQYNFDEDIGAWASVSASRSDGFDLDVDLVDPGGGPPTQVAEGTDRFRAVSTAGRAWLGPVTAQWIYNERKQFIPIGALSFAFNDGRTFYHDQRFAGELRFEPKWEIVELFTRAHANWYHFGGRYIEPAPDNPLVEDYYGTWFGGEARALLKPLEELHVTVGGEVQYHPIATMYGTEVDPTTFEPIDGLAYLNEDRSFVFGAAYALAEVIPVDWFRAQAGARVDVYSTFGPIVVPRGALIFRPVEGGVLKIMGGRAFRAPSIYEQFYNDGGFSQTRAVEPDRELELGPESIYSGEIEYLQRFAEDWVATAAVHASYFVDIINTVSDDDPAFCSSAPAEPCIRYANSDSPAGTLGGDVEIRREWRQGWMLGAFYSYQRAQYLEDTGPSTTESARLLNAPEHLAGAKAAVPVIADVATIAVRGALEAPRRIDYVTDDESKPAVIVDVALSGSARRFGVHYVVGVYNLFDWQNDHPVADTFASRTIVQNGRTFLLDLSVAYP
jgi:outer membrane receptor protein involved in Fe transport